MFGFVSPLKNDLLVKDFNLYKSYYCGLCHSIKRNYSNIKRLLLNYDLVFLSLLLNSLNSEKEKVDEFRCLIHPVIKSKKIKSNPYIDYSSDMLIILAYFKMYDDILDEKNLIKKLINKFKLLIFKGKKNKSLFNKYKKKVNLIQKELRLQNEKESKNCDDIDSISSHFSNILGAIFECELIEDSRIRKALTLIGKDLGKWIYQIDVIKDLKLDKEKNNFNPILNSIKNSDSKNKTEIKKIISEKNFVLDFYIKRIIETFEILPIKKNKLILNNIIRLGLKETQEEVIENALKEL